MNDVTPLSRTSTTDSDDSFFHQVKRSTSSGSSSSAAAHRHGESTSVLSSLLLFARGHLLLDPDGLFRRAWDMLILMCVLWNIISTPWLLAFDPAWSIDHIYLDFLLLLLMALDMLFIFRTGFHAFGGEIVYDTREVMSRYVTSASFPLDVIALAPLEFLAWILPHSVDGDTRFDIAYWYCIIKCKQLVRLHKLLHSPTLLHSYFQTPRMRVASIFLGWSLMAHFYATILVFIGRNQKDGDVWSWIHAAGLDVSGIEYIHTGLKDSNGYEEIITIHNPTTIGGKTSTYISALYWSIVSMTSVGYGDRHAVTTTEQCIIAVMCIGSLAFYAVLFSSIGASLMSLRSQIRSFQKRMDSTKEYAAVNDLPLTLTNRMTLYEHTQWNATHGFHINKILQDLPNSVQSEVLLYIHSSLIKSIPFFRECSTSFLDTLILKLKPASVLLQGDYLFHEGDSCGSVSTDAGNNSSGTSNNNHSRSIYFLHSGCVDIRMNNPITHLEELRTRIYAGDTAEKYSAGGAIATGVSPKKKYRSHRRNGSSASTLTSNATAPFFGELSLLLNIPRTASVLARVHTYYNELTYDDFHDLISLFPLNAEDRSLREEGKKRLKNDEIWIERSVMKRKNKLNLLKNGPQGKNIRTTIQNLVDTIQWRIEELESGGGGGVGGTVGGIDPQQQQQQYETTGGNHDFHAITDTQDHLQHPQARSPTEDEDDLNHPSHPRQLIKRSSFEHLVSNHPASPSNSNGGGGGGGRGHHHHTRIDSSDLRGHFPVDGLQELVTPKNNLIDREHMYQAQQHYLRQQRSSPSPPPQLTLPGSFNEKDGENNTIVISAVHPHRAASPSPSPLGSPSSKSHSYLRSLSNSRHHSNTHFTPSHSQNSLSKERLLKTALQAQQAGILPLAIPKSSPSQSPLASPSRATRLHHQLKTMKMIGQQQSSPSSSPIMRSASLAKRSIPAIGSGNTQQKSSPENNGVAAAAPPTYPHSPTPDLLFEASPMSPISVLPIHLQQQLQPSQPQSQQLAPLHSPAAATNKPISPWTRASFHDLQASVQMNMEGFIARGDSDSGLHRQGSLVNKTASPKSFKPREATKGDSSSDGDHSPSRSSPNAHNRTTPKRQLSNRVRQSGAISFSTRHDIIAAQQQRDYEVKMKRQAILMEMNAPAADGSGGSSSDLRQQQQSQLHRQDSDPTSSPMRKRRSGGVLRSRRGTMTMAGGVPQDSSGPSSSPSSGPSRRGTGGAIMRGELLARLANHSTRDLIADAMTRAMSDGIIGSNGGGGASSVPGDAPMTRASSPSHSTIVSPPLSRQTTMGPGMMNRALMASPDPSTTIGGSATVFTTAAAASSVSRRASLHADHEVELDELARLRNRRDSTVIAGIESRQKSGRRSGETMSPEAPAPFFQSVQAALHPQPSVAQDTTIMHAQPSTATPPPPTHNSLLTRTPSPTRVLKPATQRTRPGASPTVMSPKLQTNSMRRRERGS